MSEPTKILLEEHEIPTHWYNVVADMPNPPAPPLGPDGQPVPPEKMLAIFPGNLLEQEMSAERWIAIPGEVREAYRLWRPSPLYRAHRLERGHELAGCRQAHCPPAVALVDDLDRSPPLDRHIRHAAAADGGPIDNADNAARCKAIVDGAGTDVSATSATPTAPGT